MKPLPLYKCLDPPLNGISLVFTQVILTILHTRQISIGNITYQHTDSTKAVSAIPNTHSTVEFQVLGKRTSFSAVFPKFQLPPIDSCLSCPHTCSLCCLLSKLVQIFPAFYCEKLIIIWFFFGIKKIVGYHAICHVPLIIRLISNYIP